MSEQSLSMYLSSADPLAAEVFQLLLHHREEGGLVDYKLAFSDEGAELERRAASGG